MATAIGAAGPVRIRPRPEPRGNAGPRKCWPGLETAAQVTAPRDRCDRSPSSCGPRGTAAPAATAGKPARNHDLAERAPAPTAPHLARCQPEAAGADAIAQTRWCRNARQRILRPCKFVHVGAASDGIDRITVRLHPGRAWPRRCEDGSGRRRPRHGNGDSRSTHWSCSSATAGLSNARSKSPDCAPIRRA